MLHRRLMISLAAAVAALALAATALAAPHHPQAGHARTFSGRVLSINVRRHTLRLRVTRAGARAAAVGSGGPVVAVSFGDASVRGPDGAVAVGDEVTVTTSGGSGPAAVATSIQVIGQPNGGDAGQGAAIPGVVTAVDAANGQLTLAVTATDAQGNSHLSSLIVMVSPSTILAVGSHGSGGSVSLGDIAVGDHLVVFTADAAADPITAIGILDASNAGANHEDGGGDGPQRTAIPGSVASVDAAGGTLVMTAGGDGPSAGQQITVTVTPQTCFGGDGADGGRPFGLADIQSGDRIVVYAPAPPANGQAVALGIVDDTSHGGAVEYSGVRGTVSEVGPSSLDLLVSGDGPLAGQTVTVDAAAGATFRGTNGSGGQVSGFADIQVGDRVAAYTTTGLASQPLEAVVIADRGAQSADGPAAFRFGGTVSDVRGDGLTVDVTGDGPLAGQSVTVAVTATTRFATPQGEGTGPASLANVSVGDPVEIFTTSESTTPVVAIGVVDDSAATGSESQAS